jgi:2-amino-4-hydroxy-6-hydroxymethyldihydropteridine diphosphokinase
MSDRDRDVTVYLGLGANLGDRLQNICSAVAKLTSRPGIDFDPEFDAASIYETSPIGGPPDQGPYLNTVIRIRTSLSPEDLLEMCLSVERSLGRIRTERNGPRVIDIDILLFGDLVFDVAGLTIPHPRMHERRFVLEPLADLSPDLVHPGLGGTVTDCLRAAPGPEAERASGTRLAGPDWIFRCGGADYRAGDKAGTSR